MDELRRRLQEVVRANPWVLGRIEGPALVFEDPAPAGGDPGSWPVDLFRVFSPGELRVHRQMDLADLPNALSPTKCGGRAKDTFVRVRQVRVRQVQERVRQVRVQTWRPREAHWTLRHDAFYSSPTKSGVGVLESRTAPQASLISCVVHWNAFRQKTARTWS